MEKEYRLGAKVKASAAEEMRRFLGANHLLDDRYYVSRNKEGTKIVFPLLRYPSLAESALLDATVDHEVVVSKFKFTRRKKRTRTLKEAISEYIPLDKRDFIPSSLDVIGDLAIVELSPPLTSYGHIIGKGVTEVNPHVVGVFGKAGVVSGEYRLRQLKWLYGKKRTLTVHKENGCRYHVDIAHVYFSSRLSTERVRVVSHVHEGETVLDMFAGVGPFSVLAARQGAKVIAVDVNPSATRLLAQNAKLNKVQGKVNIFTGNIRNVDRRLWWGQCDHVIMNLPGHAVDFIDLAIGSLTPRGGVIHFYCFQKEPEATRHALTFFEKQVTANHGVIKEVLDVRKVRMSAPHEWQICVEAKVIREK